MKQFTRAFYKTNYTEYNINKKRFKRDESLFFSYEEGEIKRIRVYTCNKHAPYKKELILVCPLDNMYF